MADESGSNVQHIAELAFDLSYIQKQFELLNQMISQQGVTMHEYTAANWKLGGVFDNRAAGGDQQAASIAKANTQLQQQLSLLESANTKTNTLGGTITKAFGGYQLLNLGKKALTETFSIMKDVESQMIGISRVLDLSTESTTRLRDSIFDLGKAYGTSFADTGQIVQTFAQAGYDMADSMKLAESSLLAMNTAELDAKNSTQSMIGILKQWGLEASDLAGIIDKLNYTADNNAVTTQDLVDGMLRASGAAKNANISFDETIGLLVAMGEASGRTGREVGNALNSIIAFTRRDKSLDVFESLGVKVYADEARESFVPLLEVWEQLANKVKTGGNEVVKVLSGMEGAADLVRKEVAEATGMQEQYNALLEQEAKLTQANITEVEKKAILDQASVMRQNYWIGLLQNFAKVQDVVNDTRQAEGHSLRENEKTMQTLEKRVEQLITSLHELAVQAGDAGLLDMAKWAVDTATSIAALTKNVGGLIPVMVGLTAIIATAKRSKLFFGDDATFSGAINGIQNLRDVLKTLQADIALNGFSVEALGSSLASALGPTGAVSLAVAGLGILTTAVNAYRQAQDDARERDIAAGEAAYEQANSLDVLIKKHDELIASGRNPYDQEFLDLEIQIIQALGGHTEALNGLTIGTEGYAAALRTANEEMRDFAIGKLGRELQAEYERVINSLEESYGSMAVAFSPNAGTAEGFLSDFYLRIQQVQDGVDGINADRLNQVISSVEENANAMLETFLQMQTITHEITTPQGLEIFISEMAELLGGAKSAEAAVRSFMISIPQYAALMGSAAQSNDDFAESETDAEENAKKLAKAITEAMAAAQTAVNDIESAMEALASGKGLDLDATLNLISKYPELANAIRWVGDEWYFSADALEVLRQAKYADLMATQAQAIVSELSSKGHTVEANAISVLIAQMQNATSAAQQMAIAQQIIQTAQSGTIATTNTLTAAIQSLNLAMAGMKAQTNLQSGLAYSSKPVSTGGGGGGGGGGGRSKENPRIKEIQKEQKEQQKLFDAEKKGIQKGLKEFEKAKKKEIELQKDLKKEADKLHKSTIDNLKEQQKAAKERWNDEKEAVKSRYDAEIRALQDLKAAENRTDDRADYEKSRVELLKERADMEKRTSREAVERIKEIDKAVADLDENERRRLRDNEIDDQITKLEDKRDAEIKAIEAASEVEQKRYEAQIKAAEAAKEAAAEYHEQQIKNLQAEVEAEKERVEKALEAKQEEWDKKKEAYENELEKLRELSAGGSASAAAIGSAFKEMVEFTELQFQQMFQALTLAGDSWAKEQLKANEEVVKSFSWIQQAMAELSKEMGTILDFDQFLHYSQPSWASSNAQWYNRIPSSHTGSLITGDGLVNLQAGELVVRSDISKGLIDLVESSRQTPTITNNMYHEEAQSSHRQQSIRIDMRGANFGQGNNPRRIGKGIGEEIMKLRNRLP